MLTHFITLKFIPDTPPEHRAEFVQKMLALKDSIDELLAIKIACDIVHERRSWSLIVELQVADLGALVRYQQHPAHQAVVAFNAPFVDSVGVIDFEHYEVRKLGA